MDLNCCSGGGGGGSSASLIETLLNPGGPISKGYVVRASGNSAFALTDASTPSGSDARGVLGAILDAIIPAATPGQIVTHGMADLRFISGLVPSSGQAVWLSELAGHATTIPPDGSFLVPIGTLEDVLAYTGTAGQLMRVKLQIKPDPPTMSRSAGAFHQNTTTGFENILVIPLRPSTDGFDLAYVAVVDVAAIAAGAPPVEDDGGFVRAVTVRSVNGILTFDGGQTVLHWETDAGYEIRFAISGQNLLIQGKGATAALPTFSATCRLTAAKRPSIIEET